MVVRVEFAGCQVSGLNESGRLALKRGGPARPHGVIKFQHRRKISCGSYSEHTCAHSRPHDPRKLLAIEGAWIYRKPGVVMSIIPLDFQRRCEQRWAARFLRPMPTAPQRQFEMQDQKLAAPGKAKRKTRRVKATGLRPAPAV
jgi:hypothetical protein